jgi:hypothetical protein
MANTIILKRSATPSKVPTTSQLALGEVAINTFDGRMFIKKDDGTPSVVEIGGVTSVNGQTGDAVLSTTEVSEGSNQYFTTARARASVSAGSGISYNSSTGVISTAQGLTTTSSPTFAGLTLNGNVTITGNIIPTADNIYSLGSASMQWKDVFVGPGSLYVNGTEVIHSTDQSMNFTADADQNIRLTTTGAGVLQLGSSTTNVTVDGTLQIASGKNITDSAGVQVAFGDNIQMNGNKVVGLGAPSSANDAATKTYVDTSIAAISTSTISQGNSSVAVVDTGSGTVNVTIDGSTALSVTSSGVVVAGNFTVQGTTTTVQSNTVAVADNILTLNSDTTGTPTQNAGIEVERGDEANVQMRWNEAQGKWTFTNDGAVYYPVSVSTTDLAEGTNQYFTTARARSSVSASSATGVSYNSTTGLISLGSIPNSSLTNSDITINGATISLGGATTFTTDSIGEGSVNKYFSNTLARGAVSAGTGLAFDSSTGVFSASAVPNSSLANSSISINGVSTSLGGTRTLVTDDISEDASPSNLWFTNARARGALSFSAGSGAYNSSTGVITIPTNTNQLTNGAGFATTSYVDSAVAGKDNTDEITEGTTNLYFTQARARASVSASGSISYNSSTGVFSYTAPTVVSAFTNDAGYITSSASITGNAATATKWATARTITLGGDLTGSVSVDGSANVTLTATVAANSVALGTDTTGNYVATVSAGTGISVSGSGTENAGVTVTNTGVTSFNGGTGAITLSNFHSAVQTVTSTQATSNETASVNFTFSELSGAVHYNVLLNRMILRPGEFSVSGTTVTIAAGTLATDDELEVTGAKVV